MTEEHQHRYPRGPQEPPPRTPASPSYPEHPELTHPAGDLPGSAASPIHLIENGRALAAFAVADAIRPESPEAVRRLHENGIEVVMLTGDARAVAEGVAAELGIDTVFAQVLPEDKADKIQELQAQGKQVAIPLAAGVLQPGGIVLHPAIGAVLMSLSTVIVALNAQLLRRAEL